MNKVILIDMEVTDFHANSNPFVIGFPALTGIDGFVHAIERESDIQIIGWSFAACTLSVREGHFKAINYELRHKAKHADTPYIRDRRSGSLTGLMMLMVDEETLPADVCDYLEDSLLSLRFCGGNLSIPSVSLWHSVHEALEFIASTKVQPPFFIEDRSALLDEAPRGISKTEWLLDLTSGAHRDQNGELIYAHSMEFQGHLIPIVNGYQLLEAPRSRPNLRSEYLHAHAEPTIGVGRLRSLASVLAHWNESSDSGAAIFWFGTFDESENSWRLLTF